MVGIDAGRTNGDSSSENWVFTCHRFASGIFFIVFPLIWTSTMNGEPIVVFLFL